MNTENLKRIIDQISRDKGIDRALLVEAIEEAVRSAARKKLWQPPRHRGAVQ